MLWSRLIQTSKNGISRFSSSSMVNLMLGCLLFRKSRNLEAVSLLSNKEKVFFRPHAELSLSFLIYKDRFNRSQKSKIVYKASCWDCDAFYFGKTKRRLHGRKTKHFKALTQIGHASAVGDHSISTGHIKWDHFEILASGQYDLQCRIKETLLYGT